MSSKQRYTIETGTVLPFSLLLFFTDSYNLMNQHKAFLVPAVMAAGLTKGARSIGDGRLRELK